MVLASYFLAPRQGPAADHQQFNSGNDSIAIVYLRRVAHLARTRVADLYVVTDL